MQPEMDDPTIAVLLEALPEMRSAYALLAETDEDPSPQLLFNELADRAAALLRSSEDEEQLERIFAAVERVASTPGPDVAASVAFGFLDALPTEAQRRATAYVGPATERLWQRLDDGELDSDDEVWLLEDAADEDDLRLAGLEDGALEDGGVAGQVE
jgi:hypothetical protein